MTSSLVGSEMCIRDSSSTDEGSRSNQDMDGQKQDGDFLASENQALCDSTSCLLYTSDAADDM
eukprot:4435177-Prorocentrum_lima.AAC.1